MADNRCRIPVLPLTIRYPTMRERYAIDTTSRFPLCVGTVMFLINSITPALIAQNVPPASKAPDAENRTVYRVEEVTADGRILIVAEQQQQLVMQAGVSIPKDEHDRLQLHAYLKNLLSGEEVYLEYDSTAAVPPPDPAQPDRPRPAYLFRAPDGLFVNLETVRQGYAKINPPTGTEHLDLLSFYQQRARKAKKGIWAPPAPATLKLPAPQSPPPSEPDAAKTKLAPQLDRIIVYITKSGTKYHRQGCHHLRKSSQAITLTEALKKGYQPCAACKPPTQEDPDKPPPN